MSKQIIGIVGLGDLGGKLYLQAVAQGLHVVATDINERQKPSEAVDPVLDIKKLSWPEALGNSLQNIMNKATIIHWCAPLKALKNLEALPESSTLVLHSSTMHASVKVREALLMHDEIRGNISVVHCLMNKQRSVLIADDFGETALVTGHITALGLNPRLISYKEHDRIMAQSQGIFALLINMDLRNKLRAWDNQGLLVPSAHELKEAIENREANWTRVTIDTILSNPSLGNFVHELEDALDAKKESDKVY